MNETLLIGFLVVRTMTMNLFFPWQEIIIDNLALQESFKKCVMSVCVEQIQTTTHS